MLPCLCAAVQSFYPRHSQAAPQHFGPQSAVSDLCSVSALQDVAQLRVDCRPVYVDQCLDLQALFPAGAWVPDAAHQARFYTLQAALCRRGDYGGGSGKQLSDLGLRPLWLVMIGLQSPSGCPLSAGHAQCRSASGSTLAAQLCLLYCTCLYMQALRSTRSPRGSSCWHTCQRRSNKCRLLFACSLVFPDAGAQFHFLQQPSRRLSAGCGPRPHCSCVSRRPGSSSHTSHKHPRTAAPVCAAGHSTARLVCTGRAGWHPPLHDCV